MLIEERERTDKQAFYSCIELPTGNIFFENFQPGEKIWSGVEDIYKEVVFFHRYEKPDMPTHSGIIAFDIGEGKILWEKENFTFSFVSNDKVYCFRTSFDGRSYFALDYRSGELVQELGEDYALVNSLSKEREPNPALNDYFFPDNYIMGSDPVLDESISSIKKDKIVSGRIDILRKEDLLFTSFHTLNDNGTLTNNFAAIDIFNKVILFETVLNKELRVFIPDSFFLVNDLLLLLVEKEQLLVYLIAE